MPNLRLRCLTCALAVALVGSAATAQQMDTKRVGPLEVGLRLPNGGLWPQEERDIEFRIVHRGQTDPNSDPEPFTEGVVLAAIEMPSMPSMPKIKEFAHKESVVGEWGVHPTFPHGGEYLLRLSVAPPQGQVFKLEFPLDVKDEPPPDRDRLPPPYELRLRADPAEPEAGQPVALVFQVLSRKQTAVVSSFDIAHDRLMHLFIVRKDLGSYRHEHPRHDGNGTFRLTHVFPSAGEYHLFADVAPQSAGSQVLMAKLLVAGEPGKEFNIRAAPAEARSFTKTAERMEVTLQLAGGVAPAHESMLFDFRLKDAASGKPVDDLETYLAALGHLVLVHEDTVTFVHSHPVERGDVAARTGYVTFTARFPKVGLYRGWVQFKWYGSVRTYDFILPAEQRGSAGFVEGEPITVDPQSLVPDSGAADGAKRSPPNSVLE